MNILILGSGGREHALAWKIAQSPKTDKLFIAPGNAGTNTLGTNLPLDMNDFKTVGMFIIEKDIDLVIVGPEVPLVKGFTDYFLQDKILKNIPVIGPVKAGAMLEGSKDFAKEFMNKYNIPTARFQTFSEESLEEGFAFLEQLKPPYVLKADGLAAGKGVLIIDDLAKAKEELIAMITNSKFGDASTKVVIEEFLMGLNYRFLFSQMGKTTKYYPKPKTTNALVKAIQVLIREGWVLFLR